MLYPSEIICRTEEALKRSFEVIDKTTELLKKSRALGGGVPQQENSREKESH